jgi:hypothetical protein
MMNPSVSYIFNQQFAAEWQSVQQAANSSAITDISNKIIKAENAELLSSTREITIENGKKLTTLFAELMRQAKKIGDIWSWNTVQMHLRNLLTQAVPGINPGEISPNQTDIDQRELESLRAILVSRRARQKCDQMIKNWSTDLPLSSELLEWTPLEVKGLFRPSEITHPSSMVIALDELTGWLMEKLPGANEKARQLLEYAISYGFSNVVKYLLELEANALSSAHEGNPFCSAIQPATASQPIRSRIDEFWNDVSTSLIKYQEPQYKSCKHSPFSFTIACLNWAVASKDRRQEHYFEILKDLYKYRSPVSTASFSKVILQVLQSYLLPSSVENKKMNHLLLDKAISSLLGMDVSIEDVIASGKTYQAHSLGLGEKKLDLEALAKNFSWKDKEHFNQTASLITLKGDTLEGFIASNYIRSHLRLFLQSLIEDIQSSGHIDERIVNEFLCELETGWVINQFSFWLQYETLRQDANLSKRFIEEVLVDYALRQIKTTPQGSEYVVYTNLPRHSVYVAFKKHDNNEIEIRIDNLGGFYNQLNTPNIRPRHIANIPTEHQNLPSYLTLLFETSRECYLGYPELQNAQDIYNVGEPFAKKIYNEEHPFLLNPPTQPKTYPAFPTQTVGNCTHYSFLLGQRIRLNDCFGSFFISFAITAKKNEDLYKSSSINQQSSQVVSLTSKASPLSYDDWLHRRLLNQYLTLEANISTAPFMRCNVLQNKEILNSLLARRSQSYYLLVEGAAGMGKTIFSQQLAYQLQSIQELNCAVFYLPLRRLLNHKEKHSCHLIDIVEQHILNRSLPFHEREHLKTLVEDPNTVWILDGLDELVVSDPPQEMLIKLFQRRRLIVTSRPYFSNMGMEKVVDLKKFSTSKIESYSIEEKEKLIEYSFSSSSPLKNELKSILSASPQECTNLHLKGICEVPISLIKVCYLLKSGRIEILKEKNVAVINEAFISSLQKNAYQRKKTASSKSDEAIARKFLPEIEFLEELAFKSIEYKRGTCFSQQIRNQVLPSDIGPREIVEKYLKELGLLQLDTDGGQFVHASYQEYLAARYVIRGLKFNEKMQICQVVKEFVERHKNSSQYDYVFLCILQTFDMEIERSAEKKKKDFINLFLSFFNLYFPKNTGDSDVVSPIENPIANFSSLNLKPQSNLSISLINTICNILIKIKEIEIKSLIEDRVYSIIKNYLENMKFDSFDTTTTELQKLITSYPHLERDLGLSNLALNILGNDQVTPLDPNKALRCLKFVNSFHINTNSFINSLMKICYNPADINRELLIESTKFLINHLTILAKEKNIQELKNIQALLQNHFSTYSQIPVAFDLLLLSSVLTPMSQTKIYRTEEHEKLMSLKEGDQDIALLLTPIFESWDENVVSKDFDIATMWGVDTVREFLSLPPVVNPMYFSIDKLKKHIIDYARSLIITNKKYCIHRTYGWASIGCFLADSDVINKIDQKDYSCVDQILEFLLQIPLHNMHTWSDLPDEIRGAIYAYERGVNSRTEHDERRIKLIKSHYPYWSEIPVETNQIQVSNGRKPARSFNFDFSYFGYADTLLRLKAIYSMNSSMLRNLAHGENTNQSEALRDILRLMSDENKNSLEELEIVLNLEPQSIIEISNREKRADELKFVKFLLGELQSIEPLAN